jgi:Ser/Thr protein kinase RdoA (MazF antagonist)
MLAADTIPDVLAFFGLPAAESVVPAGFGISNHNHVVSTGQGGYVVKFLVNQMPESVANDIAVQQQLTDAGVDAPRYLRGMSGEYVYEHDGVHAVVSRKIDGAPPRHMSVKLAFDMGRHLALFHSSVRSLPFPNAFGLMHPAVATITSELARELPNQDLPRGIIHGYFHSGNVLVDPDDPDRVVAVLDFEEAGENLFLIDLAVTLIAVGSPFGSDRIEPDLLRAGKQGYETVRRLTGEEVTWLPQAMRYASEAWINWFQANGHERYARQHQRRYESFEAAFGDHTALE